MAAANTTIQWGESSVGSSGKPSSISDWPSATRNWFRSATIGRIRASRSCNGRPVELGDPIFTNRHGDLVHAESISQLFDRHLARTDIPRIRFHDLRHTHASLLVAAGTPIKVASERLGHAHPGFTTATYQHLVPGMSATAATDFANLITTHRHDLLDEAGVHR